MVHGRDEISRVLEDHDLLETPIVPAPGWKGCEDTQRVQVSLWYILRPPKYPISIYHNDTWTLWDTDGAQTPEGPEAMREFFTARRARPLPQVYIRLMDKILHDPQDPKLWEVWYIPYNGQCRILSINRCVSLCSDIIACARLCARPLSIVLEKPVVYPKSRNLLSKAKRFSAAIVLVVE